MNNSPFELGIKEKVQIEINIETGEYSVDFNGVNIVRLRSVLLHLIDRLTPEALAEEPDIKLDIEY